MYTLRPLVAVVALALAAGFSSFAAAGQGETAARAANTLVQGCC